MSFTLSTQKWDPPAWVKRKLPWTCQYENPVGCDVCLRNYTGCEVVCCHIGDHGRNRLLKKTNNAKRQLKSDASSKSSKKAAALGWRNLESKKGDLGHDLFEVAIDVAEMFKNRKLNRKENNFDDRLHLLTGEDYWGKNRKLKSKKNLDSDMQNLIHDVEAYFKNRKLNRKENIVSDGLQVIEDIYDMMKKRRLNSKKSLESDVQNLVNDIEAMWK